MTKRRLRNWAIGISTVWVAVVVGGIVLRRTCPGPDGPYGTFKDLIPLTVAVPAVWLGFLFQRRQSYLQQLRVLWSTLVRAIAGTRVYALAPTPTAEHWTTILRELSTAIDEVRGVFSNQNESKTKVGIYPFESLKQIYELVKKNPPGSAERASLEDQVDAKWKHLRSFVFHEFDRECPEHLDSPYVQATASNQALNPTGLRSAD
jgi:hypothetical protein